LLSNGTWNGLAVRTPIAEMIVPDALDDKRLQLTAEFK